MAPTRLHKYNLVGESNPYWVIAEPLLLTIWADAIVRTRVINLHLVNLGSFVSSAVFWGGGTVLRLAAVTGVVGIAFALFPDLLGASLHSVLWPSPTDGPNTWIYRLLGYVIIIQSTVVVLGRLPAFLRDCLFYFTLAAMNMLPLRLLARYLQKGSAMAQAVAKTSFMSMYIVQTITATSREDRHKWDAVMELYMNSNQVSAREKLESLSAQRIGVVGPYFPKLSKVPAASSRPTLGNGKSHFGAPTTPRFIVS